MKKQKLDKNILLGGVIIDNKDYQVVHLNLKKGDFKKAVGRLFKNKKITIELDGLYIRRGQK